MMFEIGVPNPVASGLTLLLGVALALLLGWKRGRAAGFSVRVLARAAVAAPLGAALCAHVGYCLVSLPDVVYTRSAAYWLAFWQGGYLFWGGLLGALGALALCGGARRLRLLESAAPSIALMLAFARLAEGFQGQGYGEYWYGESAFFCRLPFMVYDPYYESWAWALFMAEAAVALALCACLLRQKPAFDGDGALLLLGLYACAQIVLESLRRDEYLRWGFVRVEELFSAVAILAVLMLYWARGGRARAARKALCVTAYAALAAFIVLLEFATEGRIAFLSFLDVQHCYALMAAACAGCAACVLYMRRQALKTPNAPASPSLRKRKGAWNL